MINLVVALAAEARPLARHFGLSRDRHSQAFRLYTAPGMRLVVSGLGKVNAAAGVAWLGGLGQRSNCAWINVGLAGHGDMAVGSGAVARKITDHAERRSWYPPSAGVPPGTGVEVTTFDSPVQSYPDSTACDMEASAFYRTATRFSNGALVQCYKVISDNRSTGISGVGAPLAEDLISARLREIDALCGALDSLAEEIGGGEAHEQPLV